MLEAMIKPEHHKEVRDHFRQFENFFKHADRDPEAILTFYPDITEFWIMVAVDTYGVLTKDRVPAFYVYHRWFFLNHRDLLINVPAQFVKELEVYSHMFSQRTEFFELAMKAI
jgi:hypothetical protein